MTCSLAAHLVRCLCHLNKYLARVTQLVTDSDSCSQRFLAVVRLRMGSHSLPLTLPPLLPVQEDSCRPLVVG